MLTVINDISPEAWVGLAALIGGVAAKVAASFGRRKDPIEVGSRKPEPDLNYYVLEEVRTISRRVGAIEASLVCLKSIDGRTEQIAQDTEVLRDRRRN